MDDTSGDARRARADPTVSPDDRERTVQEWDALAPVLEDGRFRVGSPRRTTTAARGRASAQRLGAHEVPVDSDFEHVSRTGGVGLTFVGPRSSHAYLRTPPDAVEPECSRSAGRPGWCSSSRASRDGAAAAVAR
ncbi:hypothetical protein HBB16_07930 [Pseudonocardia sp. MCCB 268]|nr:hypothetical protein [Pseudonocardia cytotoxica]